MNDAIEEIENKWRAQMSGGQHDIDCDTGSQTISVTRADVCELFHAHDELSAEVERPKEKLDAEYALDKALTSKAVQLEDANATIATHEATISEMGRENEGLKEALRPIVRELEHLLKEDAKHYNNLPYIAATNAEEARELGCRIHMTRYELETALALAERDDKNEVGKK